MSEINDYLSIKDIILSTIGLLAIGIIIFFYIVLIGSTELNDIIEILQLASTEMNDELTNNKILEYYISFIFFASITTLIIGSIMVKMQIGHERPYPPKLVSSPVFPIIATTIGVGEEIVFRGVPLVGAGLLGLTPDLFIIIGSILWIFFHKPIQWPMVAVIALFYAQVWIIGGWYVAIILHGLHNIIAGILMYSYHTILQ